MNGFQIGSKRLKVQHKRIRSGGNTPMNVGNMMGVQPMHSMQQTIMQAEGNNLAGGNQEFDQGMMNDLRI
jgi:hypothetical protein